jgi:serine/threonine-protein kinase
VTPRPSLEDVAGAILDGTGVDWPSVDSGADPAEQPLIEQLKTLAKLRLVSKRADGGNPAPTSALRATAGKEAGPHEGSHWGHLRVFERIGQGAFGDVYRAWDTRLDREVALKLLPEGPPKGGHYEEASPPASSIIEEGRLLARVRHPNVVTIYGAERIDGRVGLWMELVNGRTLEQALHDGRAFSAKDVERIGTELCSAVASVHAAGLLHRDIKAQNVMMANDGRLVLMDFGTGRELDRMGDATVSGTPLYLAPEVLAGGGVTARSDVYSVGVVLYHLLTGSYPVQGRDLADLRRAHAARTMGTRPDSSRRIPPRLRRVLARALDPDPDRRYATADQLGAALSAIERAPKRRIVYALVALAAIAVTGLVAWRYLAPVSTPVIAVMPFKNLSSEPGSADFVDGLTSEVIRNLALIDGLQVRSQTSSFFFKDKARDVRAIGDQLGANLIVEADVLRVGNRLRINAQLVQIAGDVPLWSERFDRTLNDVFAIQDEISRAIVNKLRLTLGRGQRRYQTNVQAYELYLKTRALLDRGGTENKQEVIRMFEQVIASDPAFAPAHAGLAEAYEAISWQLTELSYDEGLAGMRPAALRALELDPLLAEAHVAMGIYYTRERDLANATKSFERAIELNPNLPQIYTNYADAVRLKGQLDEGVRLIQKAMVIDPLSLLVRRRLAFAQFLAGHYDESIANSRQILAADPNYMSDQILGRALTFAGRPEEAIAVFQSRPVNRNWERWLATAYVMTGRRKEMDRLVEEHRDELPYRQALIYAALGDKDRTFDALNRAVDDAPHRTAAVLFYPEMAFLRGDPRLDALKKKLRLQ